MPPSVVDVVLAPPRVLDHVVEAEAVAAQLRRDLAQRRGAAADQACKEGNAQWADL